METPADGQRGREARAKRLACKSTASTMRARRWSIRSAATITYLRVSVTDRCDFRCVYCMSEDMTFLPKADLLTLEELDRLCSAFIAQAACASCA